MNEKGLPARRSAIWLLEQVCDKGRLMSEVIASGGLEHLTPPDRARAQRLAMDTLRSLDRCDRLLQKHLTKTPPSKVQHTLRLGTIELCMGGQAHGVVNDLVTLTGRDKRHQRLKGLVNAVLRAVARDGAEAWNALPVPRLPNWLRRPLIAAWGRAAVARIEAAHFAGTPLDITLKNSSDTVASALGGDATPTGSVRLADPGQISNLPGFENGDWWVQDAAAALPVRLLGDLTGLNALDLCAAPGGKTMQLAAAGAQVTAVDISETRMQRVQENLDRTHLQATLKTADALTITGQWDAVLLDAPCSATGTLRRHPDLPYAKDGADISALITLQTQLIDHAWTLVRPGGRMVFCTCSLIPDEGEVQVEEALKRHKTMRTDRAATNQPGVDPAWITEEGGLRLRPDYWPEIGGMDGFYIAVLTKAE